MPWAQLVVDDMALLRERVSWCARLPPPDEAPSAWVQAVRDPGWRNAVATLFFMDSAADARAQRLERPVVAAYACDLCSATFATAKALGCHSRRRHGARVPQRFFAPASGTCMVCETQLHTWLRLLRHLCDRRGRCWAQIQSAPAGTYKALTSKKVEALDAADTAARNDARRAGHTTPIATGIARTKDGKAIGHVRA